MMISSVQPKDIFINNNVFLSHCSGIAKGVGSAITDALGPLERLIYAREHMPELSCSTIRENDQCLGGNFTGPIGLILDPLIFNNITHTWHTDSGTLVSTTNPLRREGTNKKNSPQDLEAAILTRKADDYNEICVGKYCILGVFVEPNIPFRDGELFKPSEIHAALINIPLYLRLKGLLYSAANPHQRVTMSQIYNSCG